MTYRKYYTIETVNNCQLLGCDTEDNIDPLNVLRNERDNSENNISNDIKIYSYDIDESQSIKVTNRTLVE